MQFILDSFRLFNFKLRPKIFCDKDKRKTTMNMNSSSSNDNSIYINPLDDERIRRKSEMIRDHVYNAYDSRMANAGENYRYKELAGIVLWNNLRPQESFVVSLGTGTKCIAGDKIGLKGVEVVDMHAEIIARRGLVHYLYYLLADKIKGRENILEKVTDKYFRIDQTAYEFHLFITSAPCGDSRVFLTSTNSDQTNDPHPNRKCRGLLRTKIESGAGTIPISDPSQQSMDAIRDGKSLKIMSCSDKIAKWNLLGLQGTLLSKYIKPVYLSSIIIGSFFEHSHMKRAVYDRLVGIEVSRPFALNKPLLVGFNDTAVLESNSISFAFSYTYHFGNELIGPSGRVITSVKNRFSQICRRSFFQMFLEIEKLLNQHELSSNQYDFFVYQNAKFACMLYSLNKRIFYEYLQNHEIGTWLNKPSDMNCFLIPIKS